MGGGTRTKEHEGQAGYRDPEIRKQQCPAGADEPGHGRGGLRQVRAGQVKLEIAGLLSRLAWLPSPLPRFPLSLRFVLCFPQIQSSQGRCQPWGKALPESGQGQVAGDSREGHGGRAHLAAPPAQRAVRMRTQVAAPAPCAWCPSPVPGPPETPQVESL